MSVISIYANADAEIGYGHLHRCLTIAEAISAQSESDNIRFLTATETCQSAARRAGYEVIDAQAGKSIFDMFTENIDTVEGPLLLDSYAVDEVCLAALRDHGYCVIMLEDGCRLDNYPCDLVIDSAPDPGANNYVGGKNTDFLLGGEYYPLRSEFKAARANTRGAAPAARLVVTFGGSDREDLSSRVTGLLDGSGVEIQTSVILGPGYGGALLGEDNTPARKYYRDPDNLAAILGSADLAVSAAGSTAMDLAYLGVPSILIAVSDDQIGIGNSLHRIGAAKFISSVDTLDDDAIIGAIASLAEDRGRRDRMSAIGQQLVDGRGAERIASTITSRWHARSAAAPA